MHSIRFQFVSFVLALLLVLLLLLNTYPLISSRDAIFEEKRSSMNAQASCVSVWSILSEISGTFRISNGRSRPTE